MSLYAWRLPKQSLLDNTTTGYVQLGRNLCPKLSTRHYVPGMCRAEGVVTGEVSECRLQTSCEGGARSERMARLGHLALSLPGTASPGMLLKTLM